jgi:hypothetical protein
MSYEEETACSKFISGTKQFRSYTDQISIGYEIASFARNDMV